MHSEGGRAAAQIGKSVCVSVVFTLAAVLIFALFIKLFSIRSSVIMPVNQVIKMLSVVAGTVLCLKPGRAAAKGAACGAAAVILTYFLFAIIAGEISFGWGNVLDVVFGALAGLIGGIVASLVRGGK